MAGFLRDKGWGQGRGIWIQMGIELLIGQEWANRSLVKWIGTGVVVKKLATYVQVR